MTTDWYRVGRALVFVLALLPLLPATSAAQSPDERAVRAAYVFNLTKLVGWPPETTKLVIGFLGSRETGEFLQKMLDGKVSDSRPIHVMLFPSDEELQVCSMVYIAEGQSRKVRTILDKLGNKNIVSVGEADSFAQEGGMIGLVKMGEQIRIQVNPDATRRAGVNISSHLLALAIIVRPGAAPASDRAERKVVQSSKPEYPTLAERMALHGTVKLKLWIAPDGSVRSVECVGGHPLLIESAVNAVKRWKYEPATRESTQLLDVEF